jgi:glycosyltransferase involved in cell wall biosynthesis
MSDSVPPKVSVCIPVYNGSDYIAETIQSVLSQTYTNYRIIVCDNCSTDNTADIVATFQDSRISFIRNEKNLGLVGNANRCIDLADGEYVYIIHHDDLMMPQNLEKKARILDEHPDVGLVHSDVIAIDQDGIPLDMPMFTESKSHYVEDGRKSLERYILSMAIGASFFIGSVMARRQCYEKLGRFNPRLINCNDSEMWMRILLFYDVACVGEPLVKYRIHNMMTSTKINDAEGLNIVGLKEHYLTCRLILNQHKNRISRQKQLVKKVRMAFSLRTLTKGKRILRKGAFLLGARYFFAGLQFFPAIVITKPFWVLFGGRLITR